MSYDSWFAQLQQEIHKHQFAHMLLGLAQYDVPSAWLEAYLWGYSPAEAWQEELTHWGF